MVTEEYGLIDDNGEVLVLTAIPIWDGSYSFEIHSGEPTTTCVPWLLYASPITFLELCYTYYDGGDGTLRYPKLVDKGKPVRIVTTVDKAGPTYKKVEYIHLELPRRITGTVKCTSEHTIDVTDAVDVGSTYYEGRCLYVCERKLGHGGRLRLVSIL